MQSLGDPLRRSLRLLWAAPTSALGLLLAVPIVVAGGRLRRVGSTLEIALHRDGLPSRSRWRRAPFAAITLGHVIVARCGEDLVRWRAHERVHVRQAERLGPLFVPAYLLASAAAWWRGDCPYRGNRFEVEAYAEAPSTRYHADSARVTDAGEAIQSPSDAGTR